MASVTIEVHDGIGVLHLTVDRETKKILEIRSSEDVRAEGTIRSATTNPDGIEYTFTVGKSLPGGLAINL